MLPVAAAYLAYLGGGVAAAAVSSLVVKGGIAVMGWLGIHQAHQLKTQNGRVFLPGRQLTVLEGCTLLTMASNGQVSLDAEGLDLLRKQLSEVPPSVWLKVAKEVSDGVESRKNDVAFQLDKLMGDNPQEFLANLKQK